MTPKLLTALACAAVAIACGSPAAPTAIDVSAAAAPPGFASPGTAPVAPGSEIVSGPYEFVIDTRDASCIGWLAQPIVLDVELSRTSDGFHLDRNPSACGLCFTAFDYFDWLATSTGTQLSGSILVRDAHMASPAGSIIVGGTEYEASGVVHADGTASGAFTGFLGKPPTLTLAMDGKSAESCTAASFAWILKPRG